MNHSFNLSSMSKIDINGYTRTYQLVIPPNLSINSPLVIALHGFSGNAKTIEKISQLSILAIKENFFVAFPNGFGLPGNLVFSWNAGFCCANAQTQGSDDVGFIRSLIEYLSSEYPIDDKKIFVTGISNGAMMTHRIGIELGPMLAGIIPIAGAIGTVHPNPFQFEISKYPLDVIIIHGLKDNFIPYNGDKGVTSDPNQFFPVKDQLAYWAIVNQCDPNPLIEELSDGQVIKETYTSEITYKKVIFYLIKEGTHTWPGGIKGLPAAGEPVPKEVLDASQIIINFFDGI